MTKMDFFLKKLLTCWAATNELRDRAVIQVAHGISLLQKDCESREG
jgi:hypothetical protein